jgi:wyosine [tRNA(Phe)-imidazoG37] synthetase (radical SAM superfamily)
VYCQLGRTTEKTSEPRDFGNIESVLKELKLWLSKKLQTNFLTIAGSGEPTLNRGLGELIDGIRKLTDTPVAILTNGTLLYRPDVRAACSKADVVLPSLDAGDEQLFQKICRPYCGINIEKLVFGLRRFREEYSGQIWLEVFLVKAVNTGPDELARIKKAIEVIKPDKVHLNTAVRPPSEADVKPVDHDTLAEIAQQLGGNCEVVADLPAGSCAGSTEIEDGAVLSMLKRRPCSLRDICIGLGITEEEASATVNRLQQEGLITLEKRGEITFFKVLASRL